jgi:hypothetical protein
MSFPGAGTMFFLTPLAVQESRRLCAAAAAGDAGAGGRTIVVQDAVRPYLTGADATNCRDFHKVFHSLCGSVPEQPIQRR